MQRTFKADLENAQHVEEEFASKLRSKGWNATTTADLGKFPGYDVTSTKGNMKFTFEIKNDLKALVSSDNVAVELYRHSKDGLKEPSGLSATTADYQVYKVLDKFYSIQTTKLKELIEYMTDKGSLTLVRGGDNNNTSMALINFQYVFKKRSKVVE